MSWLRFFRRKRSDAELQDEIEVFLTEETADNLARGMSPAEPRARILHHRGFGHGPVHRRRHTESPMLAAKQVSQRKPFRFRTIRCGSPGGLKQGNHVYPVQLGVLTMDQLLRLSK